MYDIPKPCADKRYIKNGRQSSVCSLSMDPLLSLNVVRRSLDLPQSKVPFSLLGLEEVNGRLCEGNGSRRGRGNLDWYTNKKKKQSKKFLDIV